MENEIFYGTTYQQLQQAVENYYGAGSDAWAKIYQGAGGYYSEEAANIIKQVPGVNITYSNSGKVIGYSYNNSFPIENSSASIIDSNVQSGIYGEGSFTSSVPSTVVDNGQGQFVAESGSKLASDASTVSTLVDTLSLAVVGVSLGTKLGKMIDSAIYSTDPYWWDTHYPTINPETWDDIATTQGGRQFIQCIFGLQSDATTMYMDERLLAQTYMMLLQQGAYDNGGKSIVVNNPIVEASGKTYTLISNPVYQQPMLYGKFTTSDEGLHTAYGTYKICFCTVDTRGNVTWVFLSDTSFTFSSDLNNPLGRYQNFTSSSTYFINGYPIYYEFLVSYQSNYRNSTIPIANQVVSSGETPDKMINPNDRFAVYHILLYQSTIEEQSSLDGVQDDPRAETHIDSSLITGSTLEQVIQQLKQNYPRLFDESVYQDTPQEDGSITRNTYIPVPIPDGFNTEMPTTGDSYQNNIPITENSNENLVKAITKVLTQPQSYTNLGEVLGNNTTNTPPNTGNGNSPIIPPIVGSASSLWKIYNPSQSEVDSFGAWLWSSNFIDQIKKLFADPMQAIIGIHKIFCNPSIGGVTTIKCGYLDSQVSSNWVDNQYTHIDCGSVNLPEYFGNVFDYNPFTNVSLFLPCIGIVPLDVADIMRSSINIKLHCDVLTGALLAEICVTRDLSGGVLYTYSGSCIVTYPVSSGTYLGAVANIVSVAAAGVAAKTISEGGITPAVVNMASSSFSSLLHSKANVQHSGSFSGASGVMGGKIPYLIITRPQTRLAENYQFYDGVPANYTTKLKNCSGYIKVKEVHVMSASALENEISEIEQLLHNGIII